jgi:hypothetical protein
LNFRFLDLHFLEIFAFLKSSKSRWSTREACRKENLTKVIDAESAPVTHEFGTGPRVVARWPQEKLLGIILAMHFGFYLMIAALVIMGAEVVYALYQLANFFL